MGNSVESTIHCYFCLSTRGIRCEQHGFGATSRVALMEAGGVSSDLGEVGVPIEKCVPNEYHPSIKPGLSSATKKVVEKPIGGEEIGQMSVKKVIELLKQYRQLFAQIIETTPFSQEDMLGYDLEIITAGELAQLLGSDYSRFNIQVKSGIEGIIVFIRNAGEIQNREKSENIWLDRKILIMNGGLDNEAVCIAFLLYQIEILLTLIHPENADFIVREYKRMLAKITCRYVDGYEPIDNLGRLLAVKRTFVEDHYGMVLTFLKTGKVPDGIVSNGKKNGVTHSNGADHAMNTPKSNGGQPSGRNGSNRNGGRKPERSSRPRPSPTIRR